MPNLAPEFQAAIDAGLVTCRKHPTDDLWILNYTPECQFSKSWDEVTLQCRGLIVNAQGSVVARPFRKFFNLSEHDNPDLPKVPVGSPFKAYEKMDGSLGISYPSADGWKISTRGSFESEQAHFATSLLVLKYGDALAQMSPHLTYLFEIIYKENRIVVDYGNDQELVLLAVIRTSDGVELPLEDFRHLPFRQPRLFEVGSIEDLPRDTPNFEGYVVRFDNGLRVKVKLDDYVRLHKLMTGITPNRVWEMLAAGQDVESVIRDLPDEMFEEVSEVVDDLRAEHGSLVALHAVVLGNLQLDKLSRKEQAAKILGACESPVEIEGVLVKLNSAILFLLLDGQVDLAWQKSWNLVKPQSGNKLICKADLEG